MSDLRVLPIDYMKIDVDLCGEVLISRMREVHIDNLLQLLEVGNNNVVSNATHSNVGFRRQYIDS